MELIPSQERCTSDAAGSFSGVIHTDGQEPFLWSSWTYEIEMSDGAGTITGTGTRTSEGFETTKMFVAGGAPRARISEVFQQVSPEVFAKTLEALKATTPPAPTPAPAE